MHSSAFEANRFALSLVLGIWVAIIGTRLVLAGILRGFQAMAAGAVFEGTSANLLSAAILAVLYVSGVPISLTSALCIIIGCGAVSGAIALSRVLQRIGTKPAVAQGGPEEPLLTIGLPMMVNLLVGLLSSKCRFGSSPPLALRAMQRCSV